MAVVNLSVDQEDALNRMRNGCILNGGVGSGKSRTSLAFYYVCCGGMVNTVKYVPMTKPCDLYIITTARKRDTLEWEGELANFYLSTNPKYCMYKDINIVVDSWNNIQKYIDVKDAFFIFDEQRVIGYGAWTKAFLKIASRNKWILLSATPGDTWMDYIPVFIANGFFKNKTDFIRRHVVFSRFTKYPKVEKYINEGVLLKYRNHILVNMEFKRKTVAHHFYVDSDYDKRLYNYVTKERWNVFEDKPIENAGEYCLVLRKIVNSSPDRQIKVLSVVKYRKRVIIFYSYDYELEILRKLFSDINYPCAEWNGHKHEPIPDGDRWVYLVQYTAGAEGWNCITADTIVFYSQSYSYKQMVQAAGRIDRRNTPYIDLYYYHLKSASKIDSVISKALKSKKQFSEKGFAPSFNKDNLPAAPKHLIHFSLFNDPSIPTDNTNESKPKNGEIEHDGIKCYCNLLDPESPLYDPKAVAREDKTHEIEDSIKNMFVEKPETSNDDFGGAYKDWK